MWSNWASDQRCQPAIVGRPAAVGEVVSAVERGGGGGRCLRGPGAGHSFTGAALTDGTLLSLERMGALLDADPAAGLVRVQAGMTLRALNEALARYALALPNLGDIDAQSIAGAVATATHGTGATLPNLSAQVRAVQLVTAAGEVVEIDGGDDLLAAGVALGTLGVVTALTLQVVPAFTLRGVDAPVPFGGVGEELDARVDAHRHFEFFVFPHADVALTRTN